MTKQGTIIWYSIGNSNKAHAYECDEFECWNKLCTVSLSGNMSKYIPSDKPHCKVCERILKERELL